MKKAFVFVIVLSLFSLVAYGQVPRETRDSTLAKVKDYLRAKQPEMALEILSEALKKQPDNAQLLYALGYTYEMSKEPKKALEVFQKAYRLNPKFPGLASRIDHLKATLVEHEVDNIDESKLTETQKKARELFKAAIEEKRSGNFDKAFTLFADCVELDIDYLGGKDAGIIETALNYYSASKKQNPKDENARLYYAIYRFFQGDRGYALEDLKAFLASNPSKAAADVANKWLRFIEHQQHIESELLASYKPDKPELKLDVIKSAASKTSGLASGNVESIRQMPSALPAEAPIEPRRPKAMTSEEVKENPIFAKYVEEINSDDPKIAAVAAYNIGARRISSPEAVQGLIKALNSDNDMLKIEAIGALKRLGPTAADAVPAIIEWLSDENSPRTQIDALLALSAIREEPQVAVPAILQCLKSPQELVIYNACEALYSYGKKALPYLEEALAKSAGEEKARLANIIQTIKSRG